VRERERETRNARECGVNNTIAVSSTAEASELTLLSSASREPELSILGPYCLTLSEEGEGGRGVTGRCGVCPSVMMAQPRCVGR
jgi:hypothetical protein